MQVSSLLPRLFQSRALSVPPAGRRSRRWIWRGLLLGGLLALTLEVLRVLFGGNVHTVVPGQVYRSAQLSADDLRQLVQKTGIRTVINLRGYCSWMDWYRDECQLNHDLNISQEDITLSANRLPAPSEIRRLIEVFDHSEYPIVLHCRQGADRTGLASAIYLMLYSDADYETARSQCGARFAHVPILSTVNMDRFFSMYEHWLTSHSLPHAAGNFRQWALNDYRADPAPARIELLRPVPEVDIGAALTATIRARNLSHVDWVFKTGTVAAIHVRYVMVRPDGQSVLHRAGFFEARVPPGDSIDFDLPFTPFTQSGTYRVNVDLADKQMNFAQLGSEFLCFDIVVRDHQGR